MNKNQSIINKNKREYLDQIKKIHENVITINTGNTIQHEVQKLITAYSLIQEGHTIVCEATLKGNKGRPDILVISTETPIAYEIVHSESQESIEAKRKKYHPIKIIEVIA